MLDPQCLGSKALQKVVEAVHGWQDHNMNDLISLDGKSTFLLYKHCYKDDANVFMDNANLQICQLIFVFFQPSFTLVS